MSIVNGDRKSSWVVFPVRGIVLTADTSSAIEMGSKVNLPRISFTSLLIWTRKIWPGLTRIWATDACVASDEGKSVAVSSAGNISVGWIIAELAAELSSLIEIESLELSHRVRSVDICSTAVSLESFGEEWRFSSIGSPDDCCGWASGRSTDGLFLADAIRREDLSITTNVNEFDVDDEKTFSKSSRKVKSNSNVTATISEPSGGVFFSFISPHDWKRENILQIAICSVKKTKCAGWWWCRQFFVLFLYLCVNIFIEIPSETNPFLFLCLSCTRVRLVNEKNNGLWSNWNQLWSNRSVFSLRSPSFLVLLLLLEQKTRTSTTDVHRSANDLEKNSSFDDER